MKIDDGQCRKRMFRHEQVSLDVIWLILDINNRKTKPVQAVKAKKGVLTFRVRNLNQQLDISNS